MIEFSNNVGEERAMARFHNGMRPVHPGEILREEYLVPLDLSIAQLAKELHVGTAQIDAIVRGDAGVTSEIALRLARYFGGDAETWLNLQQAYDLKTAEQQVGDAIRSEVAPRKAKAA